MKRVDGRKVDELRKTNVVKDFIIYPEGSVLIQMGDTKVLCNASVEERVPPFKKETGEGWVTAEYAMLPRATKDRTSRDIQKLKKNSRSVEIQRLIGRSLRSVVDFEKLGERTITVDCDVLQADGGTRTASITGGYIAMALACKKLVKKGIIEENPITGYVSAISVGKVEGIPLLDLCYVEDSTADVDMNVVMTDKKEFIEVQGTGENGTFSRKELYELLDLAEKGNVELQAMQKEALEENIIVFATKNEHKMVEIREILADLSYKIMSLKEFGIDVDVIEDGITFEENALKKAREIGEITKTIVLADDSGLEVDYLNKEPGIYSARYGGVDTPYDIKNMMILERLKEAKDEERTARFVCSIAAYFPNGEEKVVRGTIEGVIAKEQTGNNGFGYDPIFYVPEYGMTTANMEAEQKNSISHRGNALRQIKAYL